MRLNKISNSIENESNR